VGKTTLLRLVAGVLAPQDGAVTVGGRDAAQAPVPGFVFQDARLLPWRTAAGNLALVAPGADPARIEAHLAMVGLAGRGSDLPGQLSGGMQRRLALARALLTGAGLLLLDEPFAALDRATAEEVIAAFEAVLARTTPTVILVSHDAGDVARLAGRLVVLAGAPARIAADISRNEAGEDWPARVRAAMKAGSP
jgi:NitT/TauT family transport system ATP-binding protein/sulfonate transport system ATP-binding protein